MDSTEARQTFSKRGAAASTEATMQATARVLINKALASSFLTEAASDWHLAKWAATSEARPSTKALPVFKAKVV